MLRVGLTGGIGSGKSTAARIFSALGVPVYDSDRRARELMLKKPLIEKITDIFGPEAYREGELDRRYIASVVFTDRYMLERLNSVVHPCVMEDFREWASGYEDAGCRYVIQENAILFDHGFDADMDYTVTVRAPLKERIARAAIRDGYGRQQIERRAANQMTDTQRESRADYIITNGERDLIVPRIERLHALFSGNE